WLMSSRRSRCPRCDAMTPGGCPSTPAIHHRRTRGARQCPPPPAIGARAISTFPRVIWILSPRDRSRWLAVRQRFDFSCADAERASRSCHFICASLTALNELADVDLSSRQAVFAAVGRGGGGKPA